MKKGALMRLEDAFVKLSTVRQKEIKQEIADEKPTFDMRLDKFASEFKQYLNKEAGMGGVLPWIALSMAAAGAAPTIYEAISNSQEKSERGKAHVRVLAHLKKLFPKSEHGHLEEAFSALIHVAPDLSSNPLIARSMIKNMMDMMINPNTQLGDKGLMGFESLKMLSDAEKAKAQTRSAGSSPFSQQVQTMAGTMKSFAGLPGDISSD